MLSDVLSYMNTTFTLFFTIECILKLISFGGRVKTLMINMSLCFVPVQRFKIMLYFKCIVQLSLSFVMVWAVTRQKLTLVSNKVPCDSVFTAKCTGNWLWSKWNISTFLCPLQSYFKDPWNTFDFITVVGSIVDALMVEFAVSFALHLPPLLCD